MRIGGKPRPRPPGPPLENTLRPSRADLVLLGRTWVRYIREEALRDATRSEDVPQDLEFYRSFSYRVDRGQVVIYSTWPWFELLMEGTGGPYKMVWLTRPAGVDKVPLKQPDGTVLIRSTPLTTADAWIHPGIARHTFVQRAYKRAWEKVSRVIMERALGELFR